MTKALSMKMVLVRWRAVDTLSTSLKFTKQTLEGTVLVSLRNQDAFIAISCTCHYRSELTLLETALFR